MQPSTDPRESYLEPLKWGIGPNCSDQTVTGGVGWATMAAMPTTSSQGQLLDGQVKWMTDEVSLAAVIGFSAVLCSVWGGRIALADECANCQHQPTVPALLDRTSSWSKSCWGRGRSTCLRTGRQRGSRTTRSGRCWTRCAVPSACAWAEQPATVCMCWGEQPVQLLQRGTPNAPQLCGTSAQLGAPHSRTQPGLSLL